jgi:hypothetical protein
MIDSYEIYNTLTKPENLIYATKAITGAMIMAVGVFFYKEWKSFKKTEENKRQKSLDNKL